MADSCNRCPTYLSQIRVLNGEVQRLNQLVQWLRQLLGALRGSVVATTELMRSEVEDEQTMPRAKLLHTVWERLYLAIEDLDRS